MIWASATDETISSILDAAFPGSRIRKQVMVEPTVMVATHARYWSDGSRSQYAWVRLDTLSTGSVPTADPPAFGGPPTSQDVHIPEGAVLVEWGTFRGKRAVPTIYVHPNNVNALVTCSTEDLSANERVVLHCFAGFKSSYRREEASRWGVSNEDFDTALARLKELGMVTARNAVTPKGRNTRQGFGSYDPRENA